MTPRGSEHPTDSAEKQQIPPERGTDSGTPGAQSGTVDAQPPADLARLLAKLSKLSPEDRARIAAAIDAKVGG